MIAVGTRVSYEDMANPLREGTIVGEVAGQWAVLWDADYAVPLGLETMSFPVPRGDDVVLVECHATVTKHMLERAAERQQEAASKGRHRLGGWNAEAPDNRKEEQMPETTETETPDYAVGAILEYRTITGSLRRVRVTERIPDLNGGGPGFDAVLLNLVDEPVLDIWGYDDQIVSVVEAAPAGGQS